MKKETKQKGIKKVVKKSVKETRKKDGSLKKKKTLTKPEIYDLYAIWKAIPPMLKNPTKVMLKGKTLEEFHLSMGVDDEKTLELLSLKTQTEFHNLYGVNKSTLVDWNKRLYEEGRDEMEEIRKWTNKLTKNVMLAMYNKLIRKFDPYTAELWLKSVAGWSEKQEIKHTGQMSFVEVVRAKRAKRDKLKKDAKRKR